MYWQEDPNMQAAQRAAATAQAAAQAGVSAAQNGVNSVSAGGARITNLTDQAARTANDAQAYVKNATKDIDGMRAAAGDMQKYIDALTGRAGAIGSIASEIAGAAPGIGAFSPVLSGVGDALAARAGTYDALSGRISGISQDLDPLISALAGNGNQMFGNGTNWVANANGLNARGVGLLDLDPSSSAQAADWARLYNAISPQAMASMARADVQSQYDNAMAQQNRSVARSGGSVTSGNALALNRQFKQALATATAAAMTRARQAGILQQAEMRKTIDGIGGSLVEAARNAFGAGVEAQQAGNAALANAGTLTTQKGNLLGTAAEVASRGDNAIKAAGDAYKDAESVLVDMANTLGLAAEKQYSAGNLENSAASQQVAKAGIYGDAASRTIQQGAAIADTASAYNSAASVYNSYLGTLANAYGDLSAANSRQASTNASIANLWTDIVKAGQTGSSGGGMSVTSTPGAPDDFMNWKGTGHSETWNRNHLPAGEFQALLAKG